MAGFWARVNKDAPDGHWLWTGTATPGGYGQVSASRRPAGITTRVAHRVAWELAREPIPEGMHLDHLCRNRLCVNPDHLEPVTPAENVRRGLKGVLAVQAAREVPAPPTGRRVVDADAFVARRWELYTSRTAFCAAAGVSVAYVKLIENGTHQPSVRVARDLAAALQWDVDQLYLPGGEEAAA